ncbi:MAG TPA: spore coat protein U domain-containing protein [Sphingomonas sp.]
MHYYKAASIFAITGGIFLQTTAIAQTVTGTVDSTITLARACQVNGTTGTTNVQFGVLDFGTQTTLFTQAQAEVQGGGSGSAITVQCSPGTGATLTFATGLHDATVSGSGRAMSNGSLLVPYDLYSNSGLTTVLPVGATEAVTADGTVQTLHVYGKALGVPGLTADTYTDTINVTLAF